MAIVQYSAPQASFFSALADGKFHLTVPEGTEGAVKREYETSDGKKGEKWELVADFISGVINNLNVRDGDYGKQLFISFANEEGDESKPPVVISLNISSNFAEDFMKKLPNINIEKKVKLVPYSFEDENGKKCRGITVYQDDKKIKGYYHEKKTVKKGKKEFTRLVPIHGYPAPEGAEKFDSDDWKIYFAQARKFLMGEVEKHSLFNQTYRTAAPAEGDVKYISPEEEGVDPDSIPF